jgi:endoglucanase
MKNYQQVFRALHILALATGLIAPALLAAATVPGVRVSGNHFVDANGAIIQLRGVNVSALEFVAAQGWNPADPWGGVSPHWEAMKSWRVNTVRIPLNEASWLGYKCATANGEIRDPDPGHNYQKTVEHTVDEATKAGLYVILDLHWTAPHNFCPLAQNPMADEENSIRFWSQIATRFKNRDNVLFELFNEPFLWWLTSGETGWGVLRDGGTITQYVTGDGAKYQVPYNWKSAGMQQMLDAVRSTGATNAVLIGAPSWCQDLSDWAKFRPTDPLKQIAAVWHAYPNSDTSGDPKAAEPKFGAVAYHWTQSVIDAGYPVVISEFGDHNAPGTRDAPFVSKLLPWADKAGASYLGWTWNVWQDHDNVLIKDAAGSPSDGFGAYVKQHLVCVAQQQASCH